jgi:transposase
MPDHALVDERVAKAQPIEDLQRALGVTDGARAGADPIVVVKHHNRDPTQRQVDCGGKTDRPTVLYRYHPTRSGKVALAFLDEYHGYIQSDDYDGYEYLGRKKSIIHMACWAHARRKFVEVVKVRKKNQGKTR